MVDGLNPGFSLSTLIECPEIAMFFDFYMADLAESSLLKPIKASLRSKSL